MKKTTFSMMIAGILVLSFMAPLMIGFGVSKPIEETTPSAISPQEFPFIDIYTTPRNPLGASWEAWPPTNISSNYTNEESADIITLNIVTDITMDYAEVRTGYCNHSTCTTNDTWTYFNTPTAMFPTYNLFVFQFPGDWGMTEDVYEASNLYHGQYLYYQIYVENSTTWEYSVYPDYNDNGNPLGVWDDEDKAYIHPAWPPTQTNATTQVSKAVLKPGETFDVFGNAHYWPSTSYPGNNSQLIPVEETPMSITSTLAIINELGKTDANGDYSFTIQAPTTPGFYNISTDMTNTTQNWAGNESRNVPCIADDVMIQVLDIDVSVTADPNTTYPNKDITISGDVLWDDASAVTTGSDVNIFIAGEGWWNLTTNAAGHYDQTITVPGSPGTYAVVVDVEDTTTGHTNTNQVSIEVQTPTMNVTAEPSATTALPDRILTVTGHAEYGNGDDAANADVNITLVGVADEFWNSTTDANGDYSINITTPTTSDTYTINVTMESLLYTGLIAYNETDILVTAVPIPDLVLENTGVSIDAPDGLFDGENIEIAVEVKNTGIADATGVFVTFEMNDIEIGNKTIDIVQGGSTNATITWEAVQGNNTLSVLVDPLNAIEESFENNNNATRTIVIDLDTDEDGIGDTMDTDIDGDGYNNTDDDFPLDENEWLDTDDDGTGDNTDTDDDGDGVNDQDDDFPLDPTEDTDTDEDGIGNNADTDDDDDGILDIDDDFPLDETETEDYDEDGIGDNADLDDDADGYLDATEDPELWDTDNDGLTNDIDNDDDNDGTVDTSDTMPYDTDNDGLTNAEDDDDDGDGVLDKDEDLNWDGIVDDDETSSTSSDTDGDGVDDKEDYDPLDPAVSLSTDVNDDGDGGLIILAIVGIVMIIAAILGLMMMKKGNGPDKIEEEETPSEAETPTEKTE